jgi:hypothetical protein
MSTVRIQVRRGTASEWTSANPTLAAGEMGVETDTRKIKVGTGSTAWTSLSYIASDAPGITEIAQDAIDTALSMGSGLTKSYNDATNTISLNIDSSVVALKSYVDSQVTGLENSTAADYVLLADVGNAGGPAKLDVDGNLLVPKSSIILEGATADAFETTLTVVDPTADRTITLPNATGTVVLKDSTDTFTNKSISLTTNTITGTKAEFNSAMSDADFASLAGSETLTNKTLTSPIISSITNGAATLTLPTSTGTVALTSDITSAVNSLVDAAPGALDTLNELAAAIGDDANYAAGVTSALGTLTTGLGNLAAAGVSHGSSTTDVHGIANTALLATQSYADQAEADANTYADSAIGTAMTNHSNDSTDVHGIVDTADLMLKSGSSMTGVLTLNGAPSSDLHASTKKYVDDTKNTHAAVTTSVHGIADTSLLATTANVATAKSEAIAAVTVTSLSLENVNNTSDINKPVSTATQTALDLKAPLASPALTGTPTAPTAAAATDTTQIATTAFVRAEVAALVNSAGATLDTLGEIATALGNDANLSSTLTTSIGLKAPLASPTFTGTVTVAAAGVAFTDGTQTKEGVPSRTPIISKVASYTLSAASERDSLIEVDSTGPVTITIPTNSAVAYPIGTTLDILGINTGLITIAGDSGVTVNSTPGLKLRTQWSSCTLFKRAENSWVVYGDLKA